MEELWISYNQIATLDGLSVCTNLTTLYISNNLIKSWNELDKLVCICSQNIYFSLCAEHFIFDRLDYQIFVMYYSLAIRFTMNVPRKILLESKF